MQVLVHKSPNDMHSSTKSLIHHKTLFLLKMLVPCEKSLMLVQNCDDDILEGFAVANPLQTQNTLFLSRRD